MKGFKLAVLLLIITYLFTGCKDLMAAFGTTTFKIKNDTDYDLLVVAKGSDDHPYRNGLYHFVAPKGEETDIMYVKYSRYREFIPYYFAEFHFYETKGDEFTTMDDNGTDLNKILAFTDVENLNWSWVEKKDKPRKKVILTVTNEDIAGYIEKK